MTDLKKRQEQEYFQSPTAIHLGTVGMWSHSCLIVTKILCHITSGHFLRCAVIVTELVMLIVKLISLFHDLYT